MQNNKITLQLWEFFSKATMENEDFDAEFEEYKVNKQNSQLQRISTTVANVYQAAIYELFGIMYKPENITISEDCDISYQGLSTLDRLTNAAQTVQSATDRMTSITSKKMEEAERQYRRNNRG